MRILVVDDDVDARQLLVQILEGEGYQVVAVNTGLAALELAQRWRPDAALRSTSALPASPGWRWPTDCASRATCPSCS